MTESEGVYVADGVRDVTGPVGLRPSLTDYRITSYYQLWEKSIAWLNEYKNVRNHSQIGAGIGDKYVQCLAQLLIVIS